MGPGKLDPAPAGNFEYSVIGLLCLFTDVAKKQSRPWKLSSDQICKHFPDLIWPSSAVRTSSLSAMDLTMAGLAEFIVD